LRIGAIARKRGQSVPAERRSFSQNSEFVPSAGRKGGKAVAPRQPVLLQRSCAGTEGGSKGRRGGVRWQNRPTAKLALGRASDGLSHRSRGRSPRFASQVRVSFSPLELMSLQQIAGGYVACVAPTE
jgi:uncharacterized protein